MVHHTAGSNFVMRTKHCQEAGWFPTYTMCEDFALALEMQAKKYKAAYVQEFLALGEVPVTVRGTFQQRSRYVIHGTSYIHTYIKFYGIINILYHDNNQMYKYYLIVIMIRLICS